MNILCKRKDGGPESPVDAYFVIEIKSLFTLAILKFNKGSREAFHTHAFNAWTWFLKGKMSEEQYGSNHIREPYQLSLIPKVTRKDNNHRVHAFKDSWCITLRGPWDKTWTETVKDKNITLTHGRIIKESD